MGQISVFFLFFTYLLLGAWLLPFSSRKSVRKENLSLPVLGCTTACSHANRGKKIFYLYLHVTTQFRKIFTEPLSYSMHNAICKGHLYSLKEYLQSTCRKGFCFECSPLLNERKNGRLSKELSKVYCNSQSLWVCDAHTWYNYCRLYTHIMCFLFFTRTLMWTLIKVLLVLHSTYLPVNVLLPLLVQEGSWWLEPGRD